MSAAGPCPFCQVESDRIFHTGRLALGIWDGFPVAPGHALLVPRRHVLGWADATSQERLELTEAISIAFNAIRQRFPADGFNVGINLGEAAGQSVPHLHVHVIPRRVGDHANPRGGVRHVIPAKGDYSMSGEASKAVDGAHYLVPGEEDPLLPHLIRALGTANEVDIAVAFVLETGIARLEEHFRDVLKRGGRIRFLTGNYLDVTEPRALKRLLDLEGNIDRRIFETRSPESKYADRPFKTSFHPKAYITKTDGDGVAFVGSSNLSQSALANGIEWNYRIVSSRDAAGFRDILDGFERLFVHPATRPLSDEWIEVYERERKAPQAAAADAIDIEPPVSPPKPHEIQLEALEALQATRDAGNTAGLVVLATGLGKTWLSAFDSERPEYRRVLFVAHREEILGQARKTFRSIRPTARLGSFSGEEKDLEADVLFASIQTLGKQRQLDNFAPDSFDYVIVDEFHHAAASTYRRLIEYFRPKFLLGLTATPERTDGGDLLGLCQENLVYRCDLAEAITRSHLSPFHYFGVPDEVDYRNIPWRSSRFDEEALTEAVATQTRAKNALDQYRQRGGTRTLGFCVSQRHADFMADFFLKEGIRAVAVHAGGTSAPRTDSLEKLEAGELDVVFAVDMFNEGVDLPDLDTVMMLRPTESRILWIQQLGRGLRKAEGKSHLTVIDYIGNHRTFLLKPQTLFQLPSGDSAIRDALDRLQAGTMELPPGCEVTYDLKAIEVLRALLRIPRAELDALRRFYEDFRELHGVRPTATEAFHEGYNPRSARKSHGSWLRFIEAMGDMTDAQRTAIREAGAFLDSLETTEMTKSFKMLVLLTMLNSDHFPGEMSALDLVKGIRDLGARSETLRGEFGASLENDAALAELLEKNPISAWVGGKGTNGVSYFEYREGIFRTVVDVSASARSALQELTREIADWRLAEYLDRARTPTPGGARFECAVSHAKGHPLIFLPDRASVPDIPEGWVDVTADGERYQANFVEIAVNVLRRPGSEQNELGSVLRGWFGPDAGLPGTSHRVAFERDNEGLKLIPLGRREGVLQLWRSYSREEIPKLFGLNYSPFLWQQGFIPQGEHMFLLVTLDKGSHAEQFQYKDRFLSVDRFQWQSQNRTAQESKHGRQIRDHRALGIAPHLFVRARSKGPQGTASPFVYCGDVEFVRWEGTKPITVEWQLPEAVPERLRGGFGVPPVVT